ncbi:MAG TPA: glycosyltransferase [Gaiellaceae bacterium]|jgi:glycosyltransferase involved in cell wall biosynthesis
MISILFTVPWARRGGGAENMLWTFLRKVDRSRIEPMVVFFEHGKFEREVNALGIRTVVLPAGRLRQFGRAVSVVRTLRAVIHTEQPDLILNWSAKTQLYGSSAATSVGMRDRIVWWQHGIPHGQPLDRISTALPARAIGCSSRAASEAQALVRPHRPTFVVHPGIDPPSVGSLGVAERRKSLGLPTDRLIVGVVGRLEPGKGQDRLLHALAQLQRSGHKIHGLIVGGDAFGTSPDYGRYLHRLAADLDLREQVTFTGQLADPSPYLRAMDVFVSTSVRDSFGLVLLEAMAAGLPIVASDSGGPSEVIESGRSGILVAGPTEELLAAAIEALLVDPELRSRLGEAGRERFLRFFSAERMARELEDRLEELCT